jgi:hypothetical protein
VAGNYAYVASFGNSKLAVYNLGGTYSQSLQAGSTVVSTLQVTGDSVLTGDASIQGGLTVGTNAEINNNLGIGGSFLLQNATNSTTAFQVQNAAGIAILNVDTTGQQVLLGTTGTSGINGQLVFNTATSGSYTITLNSSASTTASYVLTLPTAAAATGQCLQAGTVSGSTVPLVWGACGGGSHTKAIVLTPEYAGAVLDSGGAANDIGTMTTGIDTTVTPNQNFYQWTTAQSSNQVYNVDVQIPVPSDFSSWSATPLAIEVETSDTTNGTVTAALLDTSGTSNFSSCSITPGSVNTWTLETSCSPSGGTFTANGVMTLALTLQAPTSGTTKVGKIVLTYNSAY